MEGVSDIKLIRTDTTLDLSQKAEKRCRGKDRGALLPLATVRLTHGLTCVCYYNKHKHRVLNNVSFFIVNPDWKTSKT